MGVAKATFCLAHMYHNGYGVDKDLRKAADLCKQAADAGLGEAIADMGIIYLDGDGVPQDLDKALEYFQKALAMGVSGVEGYIDLVKEKMA